MSKVTLTLLKKIFPGTPQSDLIKFVKPFNDILPKYGIDTKKRFAAFIANVGIESDRLKTTKEYGSDSYFSKYNNRADLGNIRSGDGLRYKGRSVLQNTGRFNYLKVVLAYIRVITGKDFYIKQIDTNFDAYLKSKEYENLLKEADKYNINFLANPELLEKFPHAVEAACIFIEDNNLNRYADKEQFFPYAGKLNTGNPKKKANHYIDRLGIYELANKVIPENFYLGDEKNHPKFTKKDKFISEENTSVIETKIDPNTGTPMPASLTPILTNVVEVEQVVAAADQAKEVNDTEPLINIGNKVTALWGVIGTTLLAIGTFLTSTPLGIAIAIISSVALIICVYMFFNWRRSENKEKREQNAKIEAIKLDAELKLQREEQAFELQKITLQSAMRQDLNTVRIVPPPVEIPNSDAE